MIDRIEEIRARCEEGRPIRRVDVKELLDQIHDRDVTISRLQRELSRLQTCKMRELTEVQK